MAENDPELNAATSSTETQDVQSTSSTETGSTPSSEPEGGKFDLLSVVRDAVTKTAEDSASPAGQEGSDLSPTGEPASAQPTEDDENFSDVPFHKHPRFQAIVKQRNELRDTAKTYEANAKRYENVEAFLQSNGLSGDEAAEFIQLRAQMKTNPAEAWKTLKPIVQQLLVDAGEVLPQDLHQAVQKGELTKQRAVEISRLRAMQTSGQKAQEFAAQQAEQRAEQELTQRRMDAVVEWEKSVKLKDPDYPALAEEVTVQVAYLQRRDGFPRTPEAARKMAEEAYATVKKRRAPQAQPRSPVTPIRGGRVASGQPSDSGQKTMLDIVRASRATG